MELFYEVSSIAMTVSGTGENKKGEDVNKTFTIESFVELLDGIAKNHKGFAESVRPLDQKISKRYQSVGIEDIHVTIDKDTKTKYYHFSLHYVFRDKTKVRFADTKHKQYVVRTVQTKDGEFQSNFLHFTIVPESFTVILDRRCNAAPTEEYLRQLFIEHLDFRKFGLTHAEELNNKSKLKIRQELIKDYQDKLNANFEKLKTMTFTLAKPVSERTKKLKNKKNGEEAMTTTKGIIQSFLGEDAVKRSLIDSPLKSIQVSITLDSAFNPKELKKIRKSAKDNILDYIDNDFLTASSLEFQDENNNSITRAILRGMGKNHRVEMTVGEMEDNNHVWKLHRNIFQQELKG